MSSVYHGNARDFIDLEYECRKFRICIIGRCVVGKSTLLGKVFGFSDEEARVSDKGEGRGLHNVFQPIWNDERNRALIIHDSGGFEAGESNTLQTVMSFIDFRGNQDSLAEQLHCIWYCIPLDVARPIQSAEEDFFKFFSDKKVPLVFVFTKYDKLVNECMFNIAPEVEDWTPAVKREAEQKAKDYVSKIREKLQRTTGRGVTVQQVSRRDDELVKTLVRSTMDLVRPNLRSLLIRAQGVSATAKREDCLRLMPATFRVILRQCSFPNPLQGILLAHRFGEFFRLCSLVWNIHGQEVLFVREDIIDCFRDSIQRDGHLAKIVAFSVPLGPLEAALYVRLCLKMACDLVLIFQRLFWTATRTKFLREIELRAALDWYKTGRLRSTVHKLIDGSLGPFDIVAALDLKKVTNILDDAVQVGAHALQEEQEMPPPIRHTGSDLVSDRRGLPLAELA